MTITPTTTWSTTDNVGSSLSGGNLTATFTGLIGGGVRSNDSQSTGHVYFETTVSSWADSGTCVGVSKAGVALGGIGAGPGVAGTVILDKLGFIVNNGTVTSVTLGARTSGNIIGIAIDLTNQLIWFRVCPSGNWNGNVSYAPGGTGGVSTSSALGSGVAAFALAAFYSASDVVTVNFGVTTPFQTRQLQRATVLV